MAAPTHRFTIRAKHPNQSDRNGDHFATTFDPETRDLIVAMLRQRGYGEVTVIEQLISEPPPAVVSPTEAREPAVREASVVAAAPAVNPAPRKRRAAKSEPAGPNGML